MTVKQTHVCLCVEEFFNVYENTLEHSFLQTLTGNMCPVLKYYSWKPSGACVQVCALTQECRGSNPDGELAEKLIRTFNTVQ